MNRYAKLIEGSVEFAPKNKGSIINYDLDVEQMIADGYKLFIPAEPPSEQEIRMYHYDYVENTDNITEVVVYDETYEEAEARAKRVREESFEQEFFQTSLGWIRREVTMANGSQKDFLSDLLPAIITAVQMQQLVNIIAYDKPDFTEDVTDWTQYQHIVNPTSQFIQECLIQLGNDFIPAN